MPLLSSVVLPLLALVSTSFAQDSDSNSNGGVFVYQGKATEFGPPSHRQSSDPKIIFAINADSSTGDLYFHLESPKDNQWIGVGIGSSMVNSLFMIAYPSGNGTGVTISGRTASDPARSEPSAQEDITFDKIYDEGLVGANTVTGGGAGSDNEGNIVVDAVCRKCASYGDTMGIGFQKTGQPFIFAIGPPLDLESDSIHANLQEHILHGTFTMDMTAAASSDSASVPQPPYTMSPSTKLGGAKTDNDPGPRIHGTVMCLVFVIILPLGALLLRIWNVKAHIIFQLIGWILFCMAFAGGAVASKKYNKSRDFASGHQVLGILLLIALFSQLVLGWVNHRTYKKMGHGTIMGKVHLYLGPAIIALGWINGGLGFRFAGLYFLAIPYTILIIIMVLLYAALRILITRRQQRAKAGQAPPGMPAFGYQGQPQGPPPQQGAYYNPSGGPPTPNEAPPAYNQSIPLRQYPSEQSLGQAPAQPRGVV